MTHVHRDPGMEGYASVRVVPTIEPLSPAALPGVTLTLAELGLDPLTDQEAPE